MTLSLACLVPLAPLTIRVFTTLESDPRDLWPLRHLIRVMRRHDLTKKIPTYLHTYPPTYLPTYLCTSIREHSKGAIQETCDLWDIWSEWWEDMVKLLFMHRIQGSLDPRIQGSLDSRIQGSLGHRIQGSFSPRIEGSFYPRILGSSNPQIIFICDGYKSCFIYSLTF